MKKVLISGGAGFLGSHLCDAYIQKGYTVLCVDNLSTGSQNNIEHLVDNPLFNFLNWDITTEPPSSVANQHYDIVVNLASPASPPHYQRLALETLEVGSVGTKNMLDIARKCNARFFHASTSEVYGDPDVHPQPEEYKGSVNCYGPRSMYDEAKRYAESLIYVYRNNFGVNTVIARFFNTYGPRMDVNDGRVVSNFINQAINDKQLTIYGTGDQTRSFCFVDDLISGIMLLIDSELEGPVNLGNPGEFTMKELADLVISLVPHTRSQITYQEAAKDDPKQRKPDIQLARKMLAWSPKVQLREGLLKTIEYFEKIKSI